MKELILGLTIGWFTFLIGICLGYHIGVSETKYKLEPVPIQQLQLGLPTNPVNQSVERSLIVRRYNATGKRCD